MPQRNETYNYTDRHLLSSLMELSKNNNFYPFVPFQEMLHYLIPSVIDRRIYES